MRVDAWRGHDFKIDLTTASQLTIFLDAFLCMSTHGIKISTNRECGCRFRNSFFEYETKKLQLRKELAFRHKYDYLDGVINAPRIVDNCPKLLEEVVFEDTDVVAESMDLFF